MPDAAKVPQLVVAGASTVASAPADVVVTATVAATIAAAPSRRITFFMGLSWSFEGSGGWSSNDSAEALLHRGRRAPCRPGAAPMGRRRAVPFRAVRVLVVDDEVELAEAVARGLRREGYAVDVAHDGDEALDKA